jgi:hypothetical protein
MQQGAKLQGHSAGDLLRRQATQGKDDNLGTADKGRSKGVRARDPPNFRPLIIRYLPPPKSHGPAPKQIGMILQQRWKATISTYLPDAPLSGTCRHLIKAGKRFGTIYRSRAATHFQRDTDHLEELRTGDTKLYAGAGVEKNAAFTTNGNSDCKRHQLLLLVAQNTICASRLH